MINSKKKGNRTEREIVNMIKDIFPNAKRNYEFTAKEAERGVDIENTEPYAIQVKAGKQVPLKVYKFIEQIQKRKDEIPVVAMRRDRSKWLAVMEFSDFIKLIK